MEIADHLLYTKDHEWINLEEKPAKMGITDYAQSSLGDITFIELPAMDDSYEQNEEFVSIESVKAASEIFAPMSGVICGVNEDLDNDPALINKSPYEKGWIVEFNLSDLEEKNNLMTADEYRKFLESSG